MAADTDAEPPHGETEEERLRRLREEAMERFMREQEEAADSPDENENEPLLMPRDDVDNQQNHNQMMMDDDAALAALLAEGGGGGDEDRAAGGGGEDQAADAAAAQQPVNQPKKKLSYTQSSFLAAACALVYALRTRQQWYLALVYLSSSKWAFLILGNALVALCVKVFDSTTKTFLHGGLRVQEAEGLQDFFRWNITETCLALTMFRSELTVSRALQFLVLVLMKCLHHVTILRQQHWRMTDDAVIASVYNPNVPAIPLHHVKLLVLLILLQCCDLWAVQSMGQDLLSSGPSVSILFAFEAAILLVSAWSHLLLWHLHVVDGLLNFWHDNGAYLGRVWLHTWKDNKATLTFAVELQAQAVQFLFYLTFFGFVLTYYGMPINLFREVYMSFSALKERLVAFFKYRRLMASMNRFASPESDEQLEQAGRTCIICRDEMTLADCKQLPVCQHVFHKSCLREWLTQQQSCPTCRSDIAAMEQQEAARVAAAAAAGNRQEGAEGGEAEGQQQGGQDGGAAQQQQDDGVPSFSTAAVAAAMQGDEAQGRPVEAGALAADIPGGGMEGTTSTPSSDARRDKRVRFVAAAAASSSEQPEAAAAAPITYPALFRISKVPGAAVWIFASDHNDDNNNLYASRSTTDVVHRMIATSTLVVVTQPPQQRRVNGGRLQEMLQVPHHPAVVVGGHHGWIACADAVHVCPLDSLAAMMMEQEEED